MERKTVLSRSLLATLFVMIFAPAPALFAQQAASSLPPGWVPPTPTGFIAEPALLRKLANASDGSMNGNADPEDGPYVELGNMVTGAGWISAGPGYRRRLLNGRAFVDVSAAVSWNLYQSAQARIEWPHLAHDRLSVGAQAAYQDLLQVEYFGLGSGAPESDRSAYRLHDTDVLGYATIRAAPWLSISGRVGSIRGLDISPATGPRVAVPNTIDRFSDTSAPGIAAPPTYLHADVSIDADFRDHPGHPTRGGRYRASAASYSDRDSGVYSFRRFEIEASQFVPLLTSKWILAMHASGVYSDTSTGDRVPFYLLPSLGGKNTLRGYADYRFHGNDMQVFTVESRWALLAHVDATVFADAGTVAPRVGALDFGDLKTSYGVGLRLHNATSTLLRADVGHSVEGWRLFIKISDPFKRSTPASGRSSVVPFVP